MSGIQDDQHAVFNFRMFLVLNSIQFFSIQSELVFHPVQKNWNASWNFTRKRKHDACPINWRNVEVVPLALSFERFVTILVGIVSIFGISVLVD